MYFTPTAQNLIPELSVRQELVVLARALWREGYNDHLAGHITVNLGDGTLLCNPWLLTWAEIEPDQVLRIDPDGGVIDGDWPVPPGIPLHLELHRQRADVAWAVHNHPLYGTVWADMGEIPAILDQSSSLGGGQLALVAGQRALDLFELHGEAAGDVVAAGLDGGLHLGGEVGGFTLVAGLLLLQEGGVGLDHGDALVHTRHLVVHVADVLLENDLRIFTHGDKEAHK